MKRRILTLLGLMTLTGWLASAADIDGKWIAQVEGRRGGKVTETLTLKANGNSLTGSIRRRAAPRDISEGTIKGSEVTFKVTRDAKGKTVTQQYKGTLSGGLLRLFVVGSRGGSREIVFKKGT
jgi:hypothetical protein